MSWPGKRVSNLFLPHEVGFTLAGVSAGAKCWFESFLWRSRDEGLQPGEGFGIVKGSLTPHSLIEPDRRARMHALWPAARCPKAMQWTTGRRLSCVMVTRCGPVRPQDLRLSTASDEGKARLP